ncbi:hypothetical protein SASPL_156391 [Salvia splendens]|uniref:ATP-dependent RNA helicase DDX41 n=1 Tax=Salvia splendens TaxID=180675 RepID=A0A8X8VWR7_SALSN|nr:hypothetical protein SASPL_156391 [Salvia splendens]
MILQEKEMIEHLSDKKTLMSVRELAKGITYSDPLPTGWKPPLPIRRMSNKACDAIRRQWLIIIDGDDVPPPIKNFKDMRFPQPILKSLKAKGIVQPTPIQVHGLPVILSGRDMIGIAFTGSGKTLVFVLPLVMIALQEKMMMPINPGEGPFGLVVCPSRELARQTFEVVELFLESLKEAGYPELRPLLCIGGIDMKLQLDIVKKGVHIVVATPGRLKDMLAKKKMNHVESDSDDELKGLPYEEYHRLKHQKLRKSLKNCIWNCTPSPPRGPDENSDADADPEEDFGGEDEKHSRGRVGNLSPGRKAGDLHRYLRVEANPHQNADEQACNWSWKEGETEEARSALLEKGKGEISATAKRFNLRIKEIIAEDEGGANRTLRTHCHEMMLKEQPREKSKPIREDEAFLKERTMGDNSVATHRWGTHNGHEASAVEESETRLKE